MQNPFLRDLSILDDFGVFAAQVLFLVIEARLDLTETPAITLDQLIQDMYNAGMSKDSIRERLLNDLHNGGPIFGGFRSQFKSIGEQAIERSGQYAAQSVYDKELPADQEYEWVLDEKVTNHCEDCLDRAEWGAKTMAEWEDLGLPGSGVTICTTRCYCGLQPTSQVDRTHK